LVAESVSMIECWPSNLSQPFPTFPVVRGLAHIYRQVRMLSTDAVGQLSGWFERASR
jgi:hypothetical protein